MTERILVIQTAFIGDAILTLPMIEKLAGKFPDSAIDVVCIPAVHEIFSASPFVHQVIVMDKKNVHKSVFQLIKFAEELKKNSYTKIFSPHRSLRTTLLVMMLAVKNSYGFSNSALFHAYNNIIEYNFNIHEVQRNLDLIDFKYSSENWKIIPKLNATELSINKVKQFISSNNINNSSIAIAPGSIWETKKYPEKYFREVIRYFSERSFTVIIIGGESDKELCNRLAAENRNRVFSTAGLFSIVETIELLRHIKLLVTNDSAPTHFGMCANIPVLTIYCSTVSGIGFYPYNNKSLYISYNDLKCKPCGIHGYNVCPISTFECGFKLTPDKIISKMKDMINDSN